MCEYKMKTLRLAGVVRESIVDGPGMRMTIFVQGCPHHCAGCHNPQTHDFSGGYISHPENLLKAVDSDKLLRGVTFSGGEPFMQADALYPLADEIHMRGLDVVTYTGFTYEEITENAEKFPQRMELLKRTDYLIDGRFILEQRSLDLLFRGSSNQRIIDVERSLEKGCAVVTTFDNETL